MTTHSNLSQLFKRATDSRSGNVGVIFAIALLPMIGLTGLGVDIGRTFDMKTTLDAAADAAALSAVTAAQNNLAQRGTQSTANAAGITAAQNIFAANTGKVAKQIGPTTPVVRITFDTTSLTITGSVGYAADIPTMFGKMFGTNTMKLSRSAAQKNEAVASLAMAKFMEVSFAIDNSQSMGIGATQPDIDRLTQLTGCAFGCHYKDGAKQSNETVAHTNNVRLRIDAIKDAVTQIIQSAQTEQASYNPKREGFNLYTLDGTKFMSPALVPLNRLTPSPSTDYTSLLAQAKQIDLSGYGDPNNDGSGNGNIGHGDTNLGGGLQALTQQVGRSGDGSSVDKPVKTVFLMTDGVDDLVMPQSAFSCRSSLQFDSSHCSAPFDPKNCDQLKANGVTVAVIYTTYLQVPFYDTFVQPFADEILPNLKACASGPQWFAEASDDAAIQAAVKNFYDMTKSAGVLTQ